LGGVADFTRARARVDHEAGQDLKIGFTLFYENRSETVKKTVNPSWAASAASRIPLGHVHASTMKLVKIRVFDEDNLSADDFLGEVRIPGA
jgi:Ca2+-dependent lipid-binding protein